MSLFYFEETNINQFTATADFASLHRTFNRAEGNSIGEATPPRTQSPHDPLPVGRTLPRSRGSPVGTSSLSSVTEGESILAIFLKTLKYGHIENCIL